MSHIDLRWLTFHLSILHVHINVFPSDSSFKKEKTNKQTKKKQTKNRRQIEGWAQDYGNSNIFLKPLFRGNLDPFVNNANLGAIAHTSNGT